MASLVLPAQQFSVILSNPNPNRFTFQSKSSNHTIFFPSNCTNRALSSTTNLRPLQAVPNSSTLTKGPNASTLREICHGHVPEQVMRRVGEVGYIVPTDVQQQALPVLLDGCDCVLHAQTGSGKTLAYLLLIFSVVCPRRSAVQALILVPTRELGMQVTKVARMLAAKPVDDGLEQKSYSVMALLDGGMLRRHKSWLKAKPPHNSGSNNNKFVPNA